MNTLTAVERKANGQQLALFKAGDQWTQQAIDLLRQFLAERKSEGDALFTFEQFRIYAEMHGLPKPASINAWGALTKTAQKVGVCLPTGDFIRAMRPKSHARVIAVWRMAA